MYYTVVNFGPCHPAAHGVLRILLWLQNEYLLDCTVLLGLLCRNTVHLCSWRTYEQIHGYLSRTDYVAYLQVELSWLLVSCYHDKLITSLESRRISIILNHSLNCGCLLGDTGCVSTILWTFEDREHMLMLYTDRFGTRMHLNTEWTSSSLNTRSTSAGILISLILIYLLQLRIIYMRLSNIYINSGYQSLHDSYSGPVLDVTGLQLTSISSCELSATSTFISVISGNRSDSLQRVSHRTMTMTCSSFIISLHLRYNLHRWSHYWY